MPKKSNCSRSVIARNAAKVPRVIMNEGMRHQVTKRPFSNPRSIPVIRAIMTARGAGRPVIWTSPPVITADTPMMETHGQVNDPTEKPEGDTNGHKTQRGNGEGHVLKIERTPEGVRHETEDQE